MRKTLIIGMLALTAAAANAQFNGGIKFGGTLSTTTLGTYKTGVTKPSKIGYLGGGFLGFDAHYQVMEYFAIKSGLQFALKGRSLDVDDRANFQSADYVLLNYTTKFTDTETDLLDRYAAGDKDVTVNSGSYRTYLGYVELPINAAFTYKIGDNSQLVVYAGPYLAYGIMGVDWLNIGVKDAKTGTTTTIDQGSKVVFKSADEVDANEEIPMNPLDFGVNAGVGYRMGNAEFSLNYGRSFTNVWDVKAYDDGVKASLQTFSLGVSFLFGKQPKDY